MRKIKTETGRRTKGFLGKKQGPVKQKMFGVIIVKTTPWAEENPGEGHKITKPQKNKSLEGSVEGQRGGGLDKPMVHQTNHDRGTL